MKQLISRFFLVASVCAAASFAGDTLAGGPYVLNVGPRSATVGWVVQPAEVKLGTSPGELTRVAPALRSYKVTYSNLKPGTTYYYNITGDEAGAGSFKTAPVGDADFRFVIYGDTRTRHALHQKVVDAVAAAAPDFVVHTGDLVEDGQDSSLWPVFFRIEKALLAKSAFFPCLGNHEHNSREYYDFFASGDPYYSFNWGSTHITVLDSDIGSAAKTAAGRERFWADQRLWLENDLARAAAAAFRIVVFHHPPFTAIKARQNDNKEVQQLVPLFEQHKVNAVFAGHDHNYQHHLKNGIHYVVTGGGGAPLYNTDAPLPEITLKLESVEHYVRVDVAGKKARVEAIALDGHTIDSFELR